MNPVRFAWPAPGGPVQHASAHGSIRIGREPNGVYAMLVDLDSDLGHLSAVVALEPRQGASLEHLTAGQVVAAPAEFSPVIEQADQYASQLDAAAVQRGTSAAVVRTAKLYLRAHLGDDRARYAIDQAVAAAQQGDPIAAQKVRLIRTAREFARQVLGVQVTGNLFGHLGTALEHAARSIGREASTLDHKVLRPVEHAIKRWGPMILSDIQGVISFIPGIGAGEAILKGGGVLSIAVHAAYGAIPIPPGIRPICDTVLDVVMELVRNPKHLASVGLAVIRDRLPKGLPQQIFDTLVRIVGKHHPILKTTESLAAHAVGQYTAGQGPNLVHAVGTVIPPEIAAHLSKLPDPSIEFASIHKIAPQFAVNPADAPLLLEHAQRMTGMTLEPAHARALTVSLAQAATDEAAHAAQLRIAQRHYEQPRVEGTGPPAALAIQVSPDGQAARVHASDALSGVAQTVHPGAAL
jgi:hypothetical protein